MATTLKPYRPALREARPYPTPKRKPARLSSLAAKAHAHAVRKPKSR